MSNLNKFLQSFAEDVGKNDKPNADKSNQIIKNESSDAMEPNTDIREEKQQSQGNLFNNKGINKIEKNDDLTFENNKSIVESINNVKQDANKIDDGNNRLNQPSDRTLNLKSKNEKRLRLNIKNNSNEPKMESSKNDVKLDPMEMERLIFEENRRKEREVKRQLEEDLKNAHMEEELEKLNGINIDLEHLFKESETPEIFRHKWFEFYEKAANSDKKTMTNQKLRNGRFRINNEGSLEILANFKTNGKSSTDLLHESWKIN